MKKIYLFVFAMVFLGLNLHAQDNGFGVRAGINISTLKNMNSKLGFQLGGVYRLQIVSQIPLFIEPGLMLQFKGGKLSDDGIETKANLTYLEIPVLLTYRLQINDVWTIQPAFGPFFALGVSGKIKESGNGDSHSEDLFGEDGYARRGDVGIKIAAGALIKNTYYIGIGYDASFVNINKDSGLKVRNGSFNITAGYYF